MADAMLNREYRESTLSPLPLPAALPSVGSMATSTPAPSPPPTQSPPPPPPPEVPDNSEQREYDEREKPTEKTVVINLPRKTKKQKPAPGVTATLVVQGINASVSRSDRNSAIQAALTSFDHGVQTMHDEEISIGADAALCKHLALLLFKEQGEKHYRGQENSKKENNDGGKTTSDQTCPQLVDACCEEIGEEITNTCEAIEMVYRCSAESVLASYHKVGSELLPMLIRMVDEDVRRRKRAPSIDSEPTQPDKCRSDGNLEESSESNVEKEKNLSDEGPSGALDEYVSPTRDRRLRKSTKIIGHFARVGALTQPLAYYPGLLCALKHVIDRPTGVVPREARLNCLWVLANLACNAENMVMMACQPGLLETLVRTAHRPIEEEEDSIGDIDLYMQAIRSRSIAIRALLNLSWAPENKLMLSEHVNLVEALTRALMYRTSTWAGFGRGVSGILLQSRQLAAGALRNLAAAPIRSKIRLCRQGGGVLLDKLCDAARFDPDRQVRDKVLATLHNLACADTATGYVERTKLLDVIADVAVYDGDAGNLAARTLRVLEKSITEDMEEYKTLRPVLDRVTAEKP